MKEALAVALGQEVAGLAPIAGGDLNRAFRATLGDGTAVFVKTADDAAPGAYAAEAAGLRWLGAVEDGLPVPEVLAVDPDRWIALAWVDGGGRADEAALGRGLAAVHRAGAELAGALPGGRGAYVLGPLTLPNAPRPEWPAFYAESRLLPLARMAAERGALDGAGVRAVAAVAERIDDLAGPVEPPARLHGDLWSGNVHAAADGRPYLIDPAAYGGHREVDLAMLSLFGAPSAEFYDNYDEVWPRAEGHQQRVALYQLLPLLVHAVLFGGGYGASAARAARNYV
ncbi:putative ketoamine kinase [Baekduia alba]|uniref:fructosamine kinase family protein n=1 Tax=Baekduia alba TaxID=2997333 RepID=UPI00233FBDDB|nr:fructosamine kinase family protein [Baekduia alba]WCB92133.1 putative ketoamine kinase [Baekduia alba]